MNKLRKLNSKYMFLILVFIICFIGLFVYLKGDMYKCEILSEDEFATLKTWTVEKDNSKVILPYGFKYTGEPIVLTKKIDKVNAFDDSQYLMVMSRYFDYTVYLDDTKVFDLTTPQNGFSKTMGTQLRLVRIGKDLNGKTIKLEIRPLLEDHIQYSVVPMMIGNRSDIIWHILKSEQSEVITAVLIIIFGFVLLLLAIIIRCSEYEDDESGKMFYLGMISVICGIYLACQFKVSHIIAPNGYLPYYFEFTSLMLISVAVSLFIRTNVDGVIKKLYTSMSCIFVLNVLVQTFLNFVLKIDYKMMLFVTHILIGLFGILILSTMIIFHKKKSIQYMLISIMFPIVGSIIDIVRLYRISDDKTIYFFSMGLYIFVLMQVTRTIRQYLAKSRSHLKAEVYEHLAFTDGLTELNNRLSFENDINECIGNNRPACISIDLNNLKRANDTMGHSAGDVLIRGIATVLREAVGKDGKIYRIGGDEFVVLIHDITDDGIEKVLKRIEKCRVKYNEENNVNLDFAKGVSLYTEGDTTFENLVARADAEMYRDKRLTKKGRRDDYE